MSTSKFIPLEGYKEYSHNEMIKRSEAFYSFIQKRRTVREFSNRPVPEGRADPAYDPGGSGETRMDLRHGLASGI